VRPCRTKDSAIVKPTEPAQTANSRRSSPAAQAHSRAAAHSVSWPCPAPPRPRPPAPGLWPATRGRPAPGPGRLHPLPRAEQPLRIAGPPLQHRSRTATAGQQVRALVPATTQAALHLPATAQPALTAPSTSPMPTRSF
jgi:hypothetical protein